MQTLSTPAAESDMTATDLGPLAWVLDELRKSLDGASKALRRFVRDAELARGNDLAELDASQLRIARQQLHQAVGALEMVGLGAPAKLLRAMEALAQKFVARPELCSDDAANKVERASFALTEYLEGVLKGRQTSAVALFPQYRDVLDLVGGDRVHPADLWSFEWRWIDAAVPGGIPPLQYEAAVRARVDQAVLKVVRDGDPVAAGMMSQVSRGLAAAAAELEPRVFWKISAAFFEAVRLGLCPTDVYVKRTASRVITQYATLARGESGVIDRLAQDLMFYCAHAVPARESDAPVLTAVRAAYGLSQAGAIDYTRSQFGRFDPALLAQARKRIAAATETWAALAGGETGRIKQASEQFAAVAESMQKLHPESAELGRALMRAVDTTSRTGEPPNAGVAMEVATSVLYLEAAYEDLDPSDTQMATRCARLAQRLDHVISGAQPEPLEPWMEELYRRVSDRQTMGSVVDELRNTLAQVETSLDQFFRDPQDRTPLLDVPGRLAQMRGVFSVLGLDQASTAARRMRDNVEQFLVDQVQDGATGVFEKLGNSLGAMGFLVDMLSYQRALAKQLFIYDEDTGEFRPLMGREKAQALGTAPAEPAPVAAPAAPAAAPAPQAESEEDIEMREIFLEEAREVVQTGLQAVAALDEVPNNLGEQTTLRRAFHTLKGSSRMVGLVDFGEAAWAMEQLINTWLAEQKPASAELRQLSGEAMRQFGEWVEDIASGQAARWSSQPFRKAADALRVNDELIAIESPAGAAAPEAEVEAAAEAEPDTTAAVDAATATPAPAEAAEPAEPATGTAAHAFVDSRGPAELGGEPAESVEPAEMSTAGAEQPAASDAAAAEPAAPEQVQEAQEAQEASGRQDFASTEMFMSSQLPAQPPEPVEPIEPASALDFDPTEMFEPSQQPDWQNSVAEPAASALPPAEQQQPPTETPAAPVAEAPVAQPPVSEPVEAAAGFQSTRTFGDSESPPGEDTTTTEGADTPKKKIGSDASSSDLLDFDFGVEPGTPEPEAAAHGEQADIETERGALLAFDGSDGAPGADTSLRGDADALSDDAQDEQVKVIGDLRIGIPLYNVYLNEADEWSRRLLTELSEWALELDQPMPESTVGLAHALGGSSATVGFTAVADLARLLEQALARVRAHRVGLPEHARIFNLAADDIRRLLHQFAAGFLKEADPTIAPALRSVLHADLAAEVAAATAAAGAVAPQAANDEPPAADAAMPEGAGADEPAGAAPLIVATDEHSDAVDALDADLFPIFEEEAADLFPKLGAALRQWLARPDDRAARTEALRVLHTLKGSARLAGAMRLGDLTHRMESAIEALGSETVSASRVEPMLGRFDNLQSLFDGLCAFVRRRKDAPATEEAADAADAAGPVMVDVATADTRQGAQPTVPERRSRERSPGAASPVRAAMAQSVRVAAPLLDRLVNQAGEVIITRSRMDGRVAQMRASLKDLTGNLDRLREQLREIELQSETQMQSRMAQAKDQARDFDPLEFDRFTRVQELTRIMAESVSDVATVQRQLQRAMQGAEDDLIAQARQARELQRDLLRTRMIEFESVSERLYGVVRQTAKGVGKQVKLDIVGGSMELDRSVLDRMVPAFEHMLRNAIDHGIESPQRREAAGKPATGTITIALQQEGNDVSVTFSDDGGGLDLTRIRAKAVAKGLIAAYQELGEDETANLVFAPGFSTAENVTELSGRGIGLDVVRAEVDALGGRIETTSELGRGTQFKLVVPLTTAVTQVVMLRLGEMAMGVPSNLVEIVRRVPAAQVEQAYQSHVFEHGGEQVPFFWSGALLQVSGASGAPASKHLPVLLFRSAGRRVAVHVDEVLGNQEVVVKNLGPQLSRMPGLTGMSVLASGAVVLIYNPVALATVYGEAALQMQASARQARTAASAEAEAGTPQAAAPAAGVVTPLVMVVDDSITVRRVTQRLLLREGYRVVLANDGLQALAKLQEELPAVVLSDIEMPRMDGFDLARNIRGDDRMRGLPIIMITSRIAEKHREMATELGVDHYLGKPYAEDELLGLLRHYCAVPVQAEVPA
ncbi:MAG: Hpt domain-containing protein [Rhodoferax sp.]|nr:Hpt domain-containing protein [Rhodoferax sp.]